MVQVICNKAASCGYRDCVHKDLHEKARSCEAVCPGLKQGEELQTCEPERVSPMSKVVCPVDLCERAKTCPCRIPHEKTSTCTDRCDVDGRFVCCVPVKAAEALAVEAPAVDFSPQSLDQSTVVLASAVCPCCRRTVQMHVTLIP